MAVRAQVRLNDGVIALSDGRDIALTVSERRALELMTAHPMRLLSRQRILDAISDPGSDKNDRSVDFLINRLRRKLGDDARAPQFIETRYGEGYMWIAADAGAADRLTADLVVGPVRGLDFLPRGVDGDAIAREVLAQARAHLRGADIVLSPQMDPAREDGPARCLQIDFVSDRDRCDCILSMRARAELEMAVRVPARLALNDPDRMRGQVRRLLDGAWMRRACASRHYALQVALLEGDERDHGVTEPRGSDIPASDTPRLLRGWLDETSRNIGVWDRTIARSRALLSADPGNGALKIAVAIAIHSRYVMAGPAIFAEGLDTRAADEDEIEALVTEALPAIRDHPNETVIAAKLLHFLRRGYEDHARELSEDAFARATPVGGLLPVVGQMRAFFGETAAALPCFDQAIGAAEPGSRLYLFASILKCQALMAEGDWAAVDQEMRGIGAANRLVGTFLAPIFTCPERPGLTARVVSRLLPRRKATAMLMHTDYMCGRLFIDPERGVRTLSALRRLMVNRFGEAVVPAEVADRFAQARRA